MKLYPYQEVYLSDLPKNCIMDADMGVGKTVMALEHFNRHGFDRHLLVLAPASKVKTNDWDEEIKQWFPNGLPEYTVVSYDKFARHVATYIKPDMCLIADEVHYIKDSQSKRGKAVKMAKDFSDQFIGLSATPLPNGWQDMENYSILFGLVKNKTEYQRTYMNIDRSRGWPIVRGYNHEGRLKKFWNSISRHLPRSAAAELPERTFVPVDFKTLPSTYKNAKATYLTADGEALESVSALLHYLRQTLTTKDKLDYLSDILEGTKDNVVIFYNYNSEREAILALLAKKHKEKRLFEQNGHLQNLPKKADWSTVTNSVTVAHYKSGSTGVEMTYANVTVYFSPTYSYSDYQQSLGRTHRNGQNKKVVYYNFRTRNSIEVEVYKCLRDKKDFRESLWINK